MPTLRPIPVGFGVCTWVFSYTGDPEEMTCSMAADFLTAPIALNANELFTAWSANLLSQQDAVVTLNRVHILYQQDAVDQIVVDSTSAAAPGTLAVNPLPSNCAYLAEKRTALAGRANIGRMYIPGVGEEDVTQNGGVSAARIAAMNTALGAFLVACNASSDVDNMVLLHSCFHEDDDPPCVPRVPTVITSLTLDPFIGTQRRRMR